MSSSGGIGLPLLTTGPLHLKSLRDDGLEELVHVLGENLGVASSKALVLPPKTLGRTLNYTVESGARGLQKHLNVTHFVDLDYQGFGGGVPLPSSVGDAGGSPPEHIVFIVRSSDAGEVRQVANWIVSRQSDLERGGGAGGGAKSTNPFDEDNPSSSDAKERYKVFFVPHVTVLCEKILCDCDVLESCDVGELHLDLVPFDDDLLSSEIGTLLRECSIDGATAGPFFSISRSLLRLQRQFGIIENVKGIGNAARGVIETMMALREEDEELGDSSGGLKDSSEEVEASRIDTLVVIDREVDFVTPLLTPLTYEGLIDEIIGIRNGYIKVDPEMVEVEEDKPVDPAKDKAASKPKKPIAIPLNSSDSLFQLIRNQNIEKLGSFLQDQAKSIRESYDSFRQNKDASITEIHQFVKQIPGLTQNYKSLNQHINIAEHIKKTTNSTAFRQRWQTERAMLEGEACYEYLEDIIAARHPVLSVLKLMCLQSLTSGGLKSNKFDSLRRDLVQTYGFETSIVLNRLEAMGAIKRREMTWTDSGNSWGALRKNLRLIRDNINVYDPDDISYVSSGYAPLSIRLMQTLLGKGPGADSTRGLARITEVRQDPFVCLSFEEALKVESESGAGGEPGSKKVLLVYFVGGITFMEIAALRFLSNSPTFPYSIVIATSKIVSGESLIDDLA